MEQIYLAATACGEVSAERGASCCKPQRVICAQSAAQFSSVLLIHSRYTVWTRKKHPPTNVADLVLSRCFTCAYELRAILSLFQRN